MGSSELLPVDLLGCFLDPDSTGELSTDQAARLLGLTRDAVNRRCRLGDFRALHRGRYYRLPTAEIIRIRQARSKLTTQEAGRELGVSASWVCLLIGEGRLQAEELRTCSGGYLLDPRELDRYQERQRTRRTPPRETLSAREFAAEVGHSPSTVSDWCRLRRIRARKWRGSYRIPRSELDRFRSLTHLHAAGERSGVAYDALRHLVYAGRLPHERWGRHVYLTTQTLERLKWEKENLISSKALGRQVGLGGDAILRLGREGRIPMVTETWLGQGQFLRESVEVLRERLAWERENLIPTRELARLSGTHPSTVHRLAAAGKIETAQQPLLPKRGTHLRSSVERIRQLVEQGQVSPATTMQTAA